MRLREKLHRIGFVQKQSMFVTDPFQKCPILPYKRITIAVMEIFSIYIGAWPAYDDKFFLYYTIKVVYVCQGTLSKAGYF